MPIYMIVAASKLDFVRITLRTPSKRSIFFKPVHCVPLLQVQLEKVDARIPCEPHSGSGWLICDYCKVKKTNVKVENNQIYRPPSCKAVNHR
ncbi:hypothetical protein SLA2020_017390 [Shorea laevis]